MTVFIGLNLRGVGEAGNVEIFLVWFKLVVLVGVAGWGLAHWDLSMTSRNIPESGLISALFGAASMFMAYEGFQLLTYDYEDIKNPKQTLPRAVLSAIVVVIIVYVIVAIGTTMLIGADQVIQHKEVALAIAGQQAAGFFGLVLVTVGAAFSTGSAINSTLFATARLAYEVAEDGELPATLDHKNKAGIPDRAVIGLGSLAAVLAALGSLNSLVEAASLAFLFTFSIVCGLAFWQSIGIRFVTGFGAIAGIVASMALIFRLVQTDLIALLFLVVLIFIAIFVRPIILRHVATEFARNKRSPCRRV
jgi:amino acid transporter